MSSRTFPTTSSSGIVGTDIRVPRSDRPDRELACCETIDHVWHLFVERIGQLVASRRWRIARNGILAGLVAGGVASLYRFCIEEAGSAAVTAYDFVGRHPLAVLAWGGAAAAMAVAVWLLLKWEPKASGSGIPQVKGFLVGRLGMRPVPVVVTRFLGGTGGALFGLSLGREGPSIHIGAAVAKLLSRPLRATREEEDHLVTSGASAGLAAAFNAPVSGILFGIEGLHRSFSPLVIASASTGALAAGAVSTLLFGSHPILQFGTLPELPLSGLWMVLPLGILTGGVGALVNRILLKSQGLARLPGPTSMMIALAVALVAGIVLPQVLGGGESLIGWAEQAATGAGFVALLLLAKIAFTAVSFGSGIPGGIFMPILAIGTLTGAGYSLVIEAWGAPAGNQAILAVCGMAGLLAASVRTPLTSILLTAEMSGSLSHLLPVAVVVILAVFTADALRVPPIYDALLRRTLAPSEV
ncbi:ClC family H(+)/Cl(-) exchange transporter [Changpingibacter yushuensis]|uniref:ClC family H(+)/Cl(-) exchange transporter n=1 Tax=Changpingibacter yushuensis TaxID=2758440 RepID=UPI00165D9382|nr:ClC family H(+)/Cl(-) exchange transporter [Changpingibacter yushuensis]